MRLTPGRRSVSLPPMSPVDTQSQNPRAASELEAQITAIAERLCQSLRELIEAIPGGPFRPQELARTLGINKDLSSRTLKALTKQDPLAAVYHMPGPASLRQLLRAAGRRGVAQGLLESGEQAVAEFERLIRVEAGDRISLDGMISAWLPDARERFETTNKQAVFRGMAQIKGFVADVGLTTAIVHPSADPALVDGVWLLAWFGLRRLRPGAVMHVRSGQVRPLADPHRRRTLGGTPLDDTTGLLLRDFCSKPIPQLEAHVCGQTVHYLVAGDSIGPRSAVDLVLAELTLGCMRRYRTPPARPGFRQYRGPSSEITVPVRTLVFDVLLHQDVYPHSDPALFIYDTAGYGVADMNDPSRDVDRLELNESVESLGQGIGRLRATEIPRYSEMLRHVFTQLGWEADQFRGYRCRIQYPVYGSQVCMGFEPPPAETPRAGGGS